MRFRNHNERDIRDNVKIITSCCIGEIIPLERLSNDVFSSLILGDGFGVIPSQNKFVSPVEGVVKDISENNHEITIKTDDKMIIMVSVESDSADKLLDISSLVSPDDRVTPGTPIWDIDIEKYKKQGNNVTAAVILTNSESLPSFNIRYGEVKIISQPVMTVTV
jgi:phosphotransferase system IIA component